MKPSRRLFAVLVAGGLLAAAPEAIAAVPHPAGVPDLNDPAVQAEFVPINIARFQDDPDFPLLLLARVGPGMPALLLLIVDARNGKETWSLREDAPVFYLLLRDLGTVEMAFLDEGFAAAGRPSGHFLSGGPEEAPDLLARLRAGHGRTRGVARLGPGI